MIDPLFIVSKIPREPLNLTCMDKLKILLLPKYLVYFINVADSLRCAGDAELSLWMWRKLPY